MTYPNGNGRSDPERREFEHQVLALQPKLRAFCRSLTGNADAADDLVQDAMVKALKSWKSFKVGTNLRAWLFTVARNNFLSERRRNRFRAEWDPDLAERTLTADGEILEAEASLDFHRLLLCLACIPHDQSDALIAVGYLGLSYEDAADRLDCPVGTIKSRVARGRDALSAWFEGTGTIPKVDMSWLQHASKEVPVSHRLFPIVKAYEELYEAFRAEVQEPDESDAEKAWGDLVSSGALNFLADDLDSLMRGGVS